MEDCSRGFRQIAFLFGVKVEALIEFNDISMVDVENEGLDTKKTVLAVTDD